MYSAMPVRDPVKGIFFPGYPLPLEHIKRMCLGTFSRRGAVALATIYPCAECASPRSVFIVWKRSFLYDKKPGREIFRVCTLFALGFFCVGKNASEKAIVFFHPDCTVGFGVSVCSHCRRITESCPADLYSERLVGYTTGWDLHPTLKNFTFINVLSI